MKSLVTSSGQKLGQLLKNVITRSVFIVQHGNKYCHDLRLTGHVLGTLKFQFRFCLNDRQRSKFETVFRTFQIIYVIYTVASKLDGEFCKTKHFYYDGVISDVTMFRRGWLREQVLNQYLWDECEYCNHVLRLYMTKEDLKKSHFSRSRVKIKVTRLTGDLGLYFYFTIREHPYGYINSAGDLDT